MNDRVGVIRSGDRATIELPEGHWFDTDQVAVRWAGNRMVLAPVEDRIGPQSGPIVR